MKRVEVNIGDRYGRLVVKDLPYNYRSPSGQIKRKVKCVCDCGTEKDYYLDLIRRGHTKSCGCLNAEEVKRKRTTHGNYGSSLYHVWNMMIQRCSNPRCNAYSRYGGRGIKVCQEWVRSFESFNEWALSNGYIYGLTIDRIDNDGDYEPSNCRWVSMKIQCNNRRNSRYFEINGETHTLSEWCELSSVEYGLVKGRLRLGWSIEDALTTPKRKTK